MISHYWLSLMGNSSTLIIGIIIALYDVGAFLDAISAAFIAESLGRKCTLLVTATIVTIGATLIGTSYERVQSMVTRIVVSVGIGYGTSVTPVYQSEISQVEQRGWQVCCQLATMLFGLVLVYWMDYGIYFQSDAFKWRFPLPCQCVFAV